jgi:serine phosphatase RsbU (regulator of sigma subunit)/anti-sigma regulatory factor (Ser/Thr protein kinase)/anti-anti-sigma regulatory factor
MTDDPRRLLSAVDQVPFLLAVCEGPDLRVLSLSAATRALLPGREWAGRPIREVLSDLVGQQFVDAYHEVYRTGKAVTGQQWRAHLDMPDGSVREMYADFSITPWMEDGVRHGVIGVGFDVTDLVRERKAAAELRRKYEASRAVVDALQRELLPAGLPVVPGLQVAASYLLAEADGAAGGDWFDAVPQRDGRVALIVGDVVGHGVAASGVMGQLRAVLRDRLDDGAGIFEALGAADRFAARSPGAHATTVCMAVVDPLTGDLSYCTAGHPPPLLVLADGSSRYLPVTGGKPLGTGGNFPVFSDILPDAGILLLYTDGILERPGRSAAASAGELAHVAVDSAAGRALREPGATPAERVCAQSVELLVRATGHADDITLLAAQRVPVVEDLAVDLPAEPGELRGARERIGQWLGAVGAAAQDTFMVQHALGELVTNAIEHAFDSYGRDRVEVRGSLSGMGDLVVAVRDHGTWRAPRSDSARGRGLALASQLVSGVTVSPSPSGTVATLRHTLLRPARLLDVPSPVSGFSPYVPFVVDGDGGAPVRVAGAVDAATAGEMLRELLRRGRGGTVALTVDLSAVTHLSSAGVSALHRVAGQHSAPLRLVAAAGSPAQLVLDLIGLPYVTA